MRFLVVPYHGKLNLSGIFGKILNSLGGELQYGIENMLVILIVIVIHSILKSIIENLGNDSTVQVAYFLEYLIIVALITNAFVNVLDVVKTSVYNIISFMNLFSPILIALMMTTGSIVVSSSTEAILIIVMEVCGNIIQNIIIPLVLISTTLSIVSNFSEKVQLARLSKFLKSAVMWILGIILTVFICILSIEGTLGSSIDSFTAKTSKAAVSTFIPVVGKVMGDSVDSILGCANILKNSVGIVGVVILFGIVMIPIIKISVMWLMMNVVAVLCEIIADNSIAKLFDEITESYKILFGILVSVSAMFIIGITLILRMTNGG